jgi:hypothetical protein
MFIIMGQGLERTLNVDADGSDNNLRDNSNSYYFPSGLTLLHNWAKSFGKKCFNMSIRCSEMWTGR